MLHCHDLKKGQIYTCEDCGLEIEVIQECDECMDEEGSCAHEECKFICCDKELTLKE
jgi:hypothetical protein